MKTKKIILSAIFIGVLVVAFVFNQNDKNFQQLEATAGASHNLSGYAWSDNIGWISFNCSDADTCGTVDYGVNIDGNNELSGYAWSDNIGWISFNESELGGCPKGTCKAQLLEGDNSLEGWAKALSADGDGWDGWISLSTQAEETIVYGASLTGSEFSGYVWGSDVIGWTSFSGSGYGVIYGDYGDPEIVTFNVENVINGNTPTINWTTTNADECTGSWTGDVLCSTEIGCASSSVEGPVVSTGISYTIICTNTLGGSDTATETPTLYYNLGFIESYSGNVNVDFVVSGATTTKTMIGVIPWNGFSSAVTLSADLAGADPEALPVDSYSIYSDQTLSSVEYGDGSEFSIFIAEPITNSRSVLITGNGDMLNGVEVTIKGDGLSPKWEEI